MFYRLMKKLNYCWFRFRTRRIRHSPPLACDPSAPCDLHTMLGAGMLRSTS